ncbi:hypothetical protein IQ255_13975 [Pleurocapsales cyanobacterium LEGE 10410]|nr:hypothetical protein [Pleurocapsales cyanobacterium LEGE 10410]
MKIFTWMQNTAQYTTWKPSKLCLLPCGTSRRLKHHRLNFFFSIAIALLGKG